MSAATQNEVDRLRARVRQLEAEVDYLQCRNGDLDGGLRDTKAERDALAALVADMQQLASEDSGFCDHMGTDLTKRLEEKAEALRGDNNVS